VLTEAFTIFWMIYNYINKETNFSRIWNTQIHISESSQPTYAMQVHIHTTGTPNRIRIGTL
jgi:hypothetical protein